MSEPLDSAARERVVKATSLWLERAAAIYGRRFARPQLRFDLAGTCAGQYCARDRERTIRYNPWIFQRHFEASLRETVPHEVAHLVVDSLWGLGRVRPHGPEWRSVMRAFDAPARACADFDLSGLPLRRQQRHPYRCACSQHALSTTRHNRILRGEAHYCCRHCGELLRPA